MSPRIIDQLEIISRELTKYTCQLFIDKEGKKEYPVPFGSAVLFAHNKNHYLISCAHVLIDQDSNPPYFFKSKNEISTIGGENLFTRLSKLTKRINDKYDFSIVKLSNKTIQNLMQTGHKFLDESDILTGYEPTANDYAMCIGYPANRTNVNVKTKTIEMKGLKYVSKFLKSDFTKSGFNPKFHFVIKYSINNFINNNTKTKSRGPKPVGLSGGGVWAIITNENKQRLIKLVGILTEYMEEHSILVSTRIDLIIESIRQKFDPSLKNKGVLVDII